MVYAVRFLDLVFEYRQLEKFPTSLRSLSSYVHTLPSTSKISLSSSSSSSSNKLIESDVLRVKDQRILPEVMHGKVPTYGSAGSGSGLSCTGRVSVKPLQNMPKSLTFRRPAYRSIQVIIFLK